MSKLVTLCVIIILLAFGYKFYVGDSASKDVRNEDLFLYNSSDEEIEDFFASKTVTKALDDVYVATHYGLANVIMLEGNDGIILVDTSEGSAVIAEVMTEFRKITAKPLKAIIITHFHPDHMQGVEWLLENENTDGVKLFAHRLTEKQISKTLIVIKATAQRAFRQFGVLLTAAQKKSVPGPKLKLDMNSAIYTPLHPTHIFDDTMTATVAGITFQLLHIPGESLDQISVWLPQKQVLMCADIIYPAFPNLYPLRGESARSSYDWYTSIDRIRHLGAKHLLPAHMMPLSGETKIYEMLTNCRDAIQFVNDQTIRLFNRGLHVDEIVRKIKLPSTLAQLPYLQERYGTVAWAVRNIHANYSGWFKGEPRELYPLSAQERAEKMKEAFSDVNSGSAVQNMIAISEKNAQESKENFKKTGKYLFVESQWSLELAHHAFLASEDGSAEHERAKKAKIEALIMLSRWSESINAKNYYLTCAAELQGVTKPLAKGQRKKALINQLEIDNLMAVLPYRLDIDKCDATVKVTAVLHFTDLEKSFAYLLRNCIIEFVSDESLIGKSYDVKLTMVSQLWRDILNKERGGFGAYMSGDMEVDGSLMSFKTLTDSLSTD